MGRPAVSELRRHYGATTAPRLNRAAAAVLPVPVPGRAAHDQAESVGATEQRLGDHLSRRGANSGQAQSEGEARCRLSLRPQA